MTDQRITVAIPESYTAMPLADIAASSEVLHGLGGESAEPDEPTVFSVLSGLLVELAATGTRYCGVGAHRLADGHPLYSCLTISVIGAGSRPRNPRLVLSDLIRSRSADNSLGQSAVVETETHPILYSEKVGQVTPPRPGKEQAAPAVYQLEAVVPAPDGMSLVAIIFATPDTERGTEGRKMIADMACSVGFRAQSAWTLDLG